MTSQQQQQQQHPPPPPPAQHAHHAHHAQHPPPLAQLSDAQHEENMYHTKYRDLKRHTKEIEQDNEKVSLQILQTKHNIQRLRLERACVCPCLAPSRMHC
ncbi:hypothetical protein BKA62DRAFT_705934 [Auriculariales sp. MPI-PUGE-AT-0066]|nr:hypothetical protein BKA62DRAFT_705934 [Auriculariales sp. MPI-PUGE-AT-0066]